MKFCPKCGAILFVKNVKNNAVFYCKKCGYEEKAKDADVKIEEKIKGNGDIPLIPFENQELSVFPVAQVECPKCENKEAYYTMLQTRSPDEPPTRFFKCTKCGYVWREYE